MLTMLTLASSTGKAMKQWRKTGLNKKSRKSFFNVVFEHCFRVLSFRLKFQHVFNQVQLHVRFRSCISVAEILQFNSFQFRFCCVTPEAYYVLLSLVATDIEVVSLSSKLFLRYH